MDDSPLFAIFYFGHFSLYLKKHQNNITTKYRCFNHVVTKPTFEMALVNLPVIFLHILAARAVDDGGSSLITVFKPSK